MPTTGPVWRSLQAVTALISKYRPRTAEYGTCKQNPYPAVGILASAYYGASRGRAAAFYLGRQHCQNHFSKCRPRRVSYIPSKLGYILPPEKNYSHLLESSGRILPPRNVGFCYSRSHLKRKSPEYGHAIKYGFPGPPRGPEAGNEPGPSNT